MEEITGKEKRHEKYGSKSGIRILAENSYKFITQCFSPFTPTNLKIKSCKPNQNQGIKQFERCEYKIACRPPIQLFKSYCDDKIKKNEENLALPQKKSVKTNKMTNKIFQHNPSDSESLKVYRDLYIYKSLGSVARKNLERAVAIYNANKDEIELTRRFTTKKNSNACKREQAHHKKLMKTETYIRTIKPKSEMKEKLTKDLKRSLQGILSNHKKSLQCSENEKIFGKNTNKTNKVELHDMRQDKNQTIKEIEIQSKVQDTFIKKLVVKNDVKRILPKLQIRPIERKIKEKKQLTLAVLNISLPSLKTSKRETSKDSQAYNYKNTTKNTGTTDNNYKKQAYLDLEERDDIFCTLSNRKRIVDDMRGQLCTPNKTKTSKNNRSYLLKLPVTEMNRKGLNKPTSENINLLTIQEPDNTFALPLPINSRLSMLSQHVIKEKDFYNIAEHSSIMPDQFKDEVNERRRKKHPKLFGTLLENSHQKYKHLGTSEFGQFIGDEQESNVLRNDQETHFRNIPLHSKENNYNLRRNELNVF